MQLFDFYKQLPIQQKKGRNTILARHPHRSAGEDAPLRLTRRLSPDYDVRLPKEYIEQVRSAEMYLY